MNKQAPSTGRLLTMVLFALSCFGLLLFLWVSFGGPIPFKPQKYRVEVGFPEATQLGLQADVRIAGVSIGKVVQKDLDPKGNRTLATLEIEPKFAPLRRDTRAVLRQKTLLGETYVELTPGSSKKTIPEDGRLPNGHVQATNELDEVIQAFDPRTRQAFRDWQQSLAKASDHRGRDLNDTIGNLGPFIHDGNDVLNVLDTHKQALQRLVKNTGVVFGALTQNEQALHDLIVQSQRTFSATSQEREALATSFQIFPTFLDESKRTLTRLQSFAVDTRPLVRNLRPAVRDLRPTLHATRVLAPDLKRLFINLSPLIEVSKKGLPALRDLLRGIEPNLAELGPFLGQLNPILHWLEMNQHNTADFLTNAELATSDTTTTNTPGGVGHYLRQIGPTGPESAGFFQQRLDTNRGNSYLAPLGLLPKVLAPAGIFPNFDCNNTGEGDISKAKAKQENKIPCLTQGPVDFQGKGQRIPHVEAQSYAK